MEKILASLGDGPYKLPNKKEELSSALGSLNVEYLAKAVNSIRNEFIIQGTHSFIDS